MTELRIVPPVTDRTQSMGSTDCAAICGASRYRSAVEVYQEKLGVVRVQEGPHLRRGKFLEPALLRWYAAQAGTFQFMPDVTLRREWRHAQIDGLGADRAVECKTVARHVFHGPDSAWGEPGTDEVPDEYLCQTQWAADLSERDRVDVVVAVMPDNPDRVLGLTADEVLQECETHVYTVRRHPEIVRWIVEQCERFWTEHVMRQRAPAPEDFPDCTALWWHARAGSRKAADLDATEWLKRLQLARALQSLGEELENRAKFNLAAFLTDHETLTDPSGDATWLTFKTARRAGYAVKATETKSMRLGADWNRTDTAKLVAAAAKAVVAGAAVAQIDPPKQETAK